MNTPAMSPVKKVMMMIETSDFMYSQYSKPFGQIILIRYDDPHNYIHGEMAEWFKAHAWKACEGLRPPGVKIVWDTILRG